MLVTRAARKDDIDQVIELARLAGPGFTSLAVSEETLEARIAKSAESFDVKGDYNVGRYQLVLEDTETGRLAGLSAVKSKVGQKEPFFNYKILRLTQSSNILDAPFGMDILMLVNEYTGASEVGTLFVHPDYRGNRSGAGRLISQSRYMFIAGAPQRFSDLIISELRGKVEDDGTSVFWDAVGRKFFRMDFGAADRLSAETANEFIVDLMPRFPVYVDLLPEDAQEVIGQTHPAGAGARRYLEQEGFRYDRVIDIFDGGPCMTAVTSQLRTVRDSKLFKTETLEGEARLTALISNNKIKGFRCILAGIELKGDQAFLTNNALDALQIKRGEECRIWVKS